MGATLSAHSGALQIQSNLTEILLQHFNVLPWSIEYYTDKNYNFFYII